MKKSSYALGLAGTFIAGWLSHAAWLKADPLALQDGAPHAAPPAIQTPATHSETEGSAARLSPVGEPGAAPGKSLHLRPDTVDAILGGGDRKRKLSRMGLSGEQMEAVSGIEAKGLEYLRNVETAHSRAVNDNKGEYVAIDPFPEERQKWLDDMEADLRRLLRDDRAAVIARILAFEDNDEKVGLFRREVFATPLGDDGSRVRIEEKTFDSAGEPIDTDYELLDGKSRKRWSHLLDLGKAASK